MIFHYCVVQVSKTSFVGPSLFGPVLPHNTRTVLDQGPKLRWIMAISKLN